MRDQVKEYKRIQKEWKEEKEMYLMSSIETDTHDVDPLQSYIEILRWNGGVRDGEQKSSPSQDPNRNVSVICDIL